MSVDKNNLKNEISQLLVKLKEQYSVFEASIEMKEEDIQTFIDLSKQIADAAVVLKYLNTLPAEDIIKNKKQTAINFELENGVENKLQYTSKEDEQEIVEKLGDSRLRDIKKLIGINDRYQFVKELFEGSAQEFDIAVNQINNMADEDELNNYINGLKGIYNWSEEEAVTGNFISLVQSKFA